jgi:hypothetical protein
MVDLTSLWGFPDVQVITAGEQCMIFIDFLNDYLGWSSYAILNANTINAVWGASATDIFAVGSLGTIIRSNGTSASWHLLTPSITTLDLNCIWGSSADDVYTGGDIGSLFHFNGTQWNSLGIGTGQDLRALWGSSASDIYAAGSYGEILHYDGSIWGLATASSGIALNTLWGSSASDVFAAGDYGAVYHYDGNTWSKLGNSTLVDINAVWGSTSGKVYFACKNGIMVTFTRPDLIPPVVNNAKIEGIDGKAYVLTPIEFSLTEKIDRATVNSSTIILKSGTTTVPADVSLSQNGMVVSVRGSDAYSTAYTLTLTGGSNGIKDLAGNSMKSDYSVSFTTEDEQTTDGGGSSSGACFISAAGGRAAGDKAF